MQKISLAAATIFVALASVSNAGTVRYTFDTEASRSGTQIFTFPFVSGPTNPAAGQYNGVTAYVSGTLDIDSSGSADIVTGFNLDTRVPHGLPQGYIDYANVNNYARQADVNFANGDGTSVIVSPTSIRMVKNFSFDTRFGDPYALFSNIYPSPSYDSEDATLYPFSMTLDFRQATDGSYQVRSLLMRCEEKDTRGQVNSSSCNGFYTGNSGRWDRNAGKASAIGPVPSTGGGVSAVPLPAGAVLMLSGLAGFGLVRSKRRHVRNPVTC